MSAGVEFKFIKGGLQSRLIKLTDM